MPVSYRTFRGPFVAKVLFRVVLKFVEVCAAVKLVKPARARREVTFMLKFSTIEIDVKEECTVLYTK